MPTTRRIPLPVDFSLPAAVCSYGFYMLAPNRWENGRLHRPLRDPAGRVIDLTIRQQCRTLIVESSRSVSAQILPGVVRMLRIDEDIRPFHALCPAAARKNFGRIFRSPSLFEDIVRTITSCNVAWKQTIRMNQLLCDHVGAAGDFPTPPELASWTPAKLAEVCRVGYRADRIIRLARQVDSGKLDLAWFEDPNRATEELNDALLELHGIGPYAANNILQLLGRHDRLPIDSEVIRHMKEKHGARGSLRRIAAAAHHRYEPFAPHQFLAYWFELWFRYDFSASSAPESRT